MIAMPHFVGYRKHSGLQSNADVVKVVVIGATQVGKTSFIRAFWEHNEPEEIYYVNDVTVYPCKFMGNGMSRRAVIFEIPGDPGFGEESTTLYYRDAHVIVWMYAIDDPLSLEILRDEWLPEAQDMINLDRVKSVLVGNKKDLRDDPRVIKRLAEDNRTLVTSEEAQILLHYETIMHFSEISTNTLEDVNEVFDIILFLVFQLN